MKCIIFDLAAYGLFFVLLAASAASMAIDDSTNVQTVPYAKLRERLLAEGQELVK